MIARLVPLDAYAGLYEQRDFEGSVIILDNLSNTVSDGGRLVNRAVSFRDSSPAAGIGVYWGQEGLVE